MFMVNTKSSSVKLLFNIRNLGANLPPVTFVEFPVVSTMTIARRNPMCSRMRRIDPYTRRPNVSIRRNIPPVVPRLPYHPDMWRNHDNLMPWMRRTNMDGDANL
jgi:hypothetical protein